MPQPQVFVVIRSRGPARQDSRPLEGQDDWAAHASFMDSLQEGGFVLLGGPLEGTAAALLVIRATGRDEVMGTARSGSLDGQGPSPRQPDHPDLAAGITGVKRSMVGERRRLAWCSAET